MSQEISVKFINNIFEEVKKEYSDKIIALPPIELMPISKDYLFKIAKEDPLNKILIEQGHIKDFEKEYPGFIVVLSKHKTPLTMLFYGHFIISVCYEMVSELLSPFPINKVKSFLRHVFAHEITHIVENSIEHLYTNLKKRTDPLVFSETLAEEVASKIEDSEDYKEVMQKLWEPIISRIYGLYP